MRSTSLFLLCIVLLVAVLATANPRLRHAAPAHFESHALAQNEPVTGGAYVAKRQNFFRNIGNKIRNGAQRVMNFAQTAGQHVDRGVQTAQQWMGRGQRVMNTIKRGHGLVQQARGFFGRGLRDQEKPKDE